MIKLEEKDRLNFHFKFLNCSVQKAISPNKSAVTNNANTPDFNAFKKNANVAMTMKNVTAFLSKNLKVL